MTALLALACLLQSSEIDVGGRKRTYILHVGKDAKKPAPLVVMLHGASCTGRIQQALSGMDALADRHGFAVVYPDGESKIWRYWGTEDTTFIRTLVDALVKDGTADARRVYASGMSNGSCLSHKLAIEMSDRFAAIASVSCTLPKIMVERAKPSRPVPVLYFHGTEDKVAGYEGTAFGSKRELLLPAEEMVAWWAKTNRAAAKPTVEKIPDKGDDTTVERWTYEGDAPVVFYKITGGGHTWPGGTKGQEVLGNVSKDIDASALIWEFLSRYSLPEKR